MLRQRSATSLADIRLAGALTSPAWVAGAPLVAATPAGIEWWYASSFPDALADHLRLWSEDDDPVAWSWHDSGELEWHVWTGDAERDAGIVRAILEAAIAEAGGLAVDTWAAEDDEAVIDLLDTLGFAAAERRLSQWQWRPGASGTLEATGALPPVPPVPAGYRIRSLRDRSDVPARVEVHRSAFAPSRLSVEKYERLLGTPHYRVEDDLVVEAPDGSFAAFAMAWWDPVGRVGEFEPVGTHADHRRRGLARALLAHGLRRFHELGARVVQVYADAAQAGPEALYAAVGFQRRAFHRRYERPADAPAASPDLQSGA